jgi:diacylglycerol kinase family enzyme
MQPDTYILIINRRSGKQDAESRVDRIRRLFAQHGATLEVLEFGKENSLAEVTRKALQTEDATIVVAGGDGTVCGVSELVVGTGRKMGIIPSGTFNYFARSLDIPEDIDAAVQVILSGETELTKVARINDRVFLNNASLGAYPAILQTREGIYHRWGRSRVAAYWSVIKALATLRAPMRLTVTVDGTKHRYRTPLIFAVNNAFQLEQMGLGGADCIAAGEMVLLVAPDTDRWGMLKLALALAVGMARKKVDYELHCGKDIRIEMARKRRHVARDGELDKMRGPFRLTLSQEKLDVLVPSGRKEQTR